MQTSARSFSLLTFSIDTPQAPKKPTRLAPQALSADPSARPVLASAGPASARLLVPNVQSAGVIGKGGNVITSLREQSGATIKVQAGAHDLPMCALEGDELISVRIPVGLGDREGGKGGELSFFLRTAPAAHAE